MVIVQCRVCRHVLCKTKILEKTGKIAQVQSLATVKLVTDHGECAVLCAFCEADLGEIRGQSIILSLSCCQLVDIQYRKLVTEPVKTSGKQIYMQTLSNCLQDYKSLLISQQRVQTRLGRIEGVATMLSDFLRFMQVYSSLKGGRS